MDGVGRRVVRLELGDELRVEIAQGVTRVLLQLARRQLRVGVRVRVRLRLRVGVMLRLRLRLRLRG